MEKFHFLQSFLHFLLKDLDIGGKFYSKYLGKSILLIAVFYCEPKFLPALCSIFWEEDRAKQYRKQGKARVSSRAFQISIWKNFPVMMGGVKSLAVDKMPTFYCIFQRINLYLKSADIVHW